MQGANMSKNVVICPYCGTGCNVTLDVKDNHIVRANGVEQSPVNEGKLCLKGIYGWDYVNSKDRITYPMIRKKDGKFDRSGTLERASWDEALDLIAEKMLQVKKDFGGDAIAGNFSARCTLEENYLSQKLMRAVLKTNNVDHCARV